MSAISGFSSLGSWPERVPSVFRTEPDSIPEAIGDASPIRPSVAGPGHHVDGLQALRALLHVELDFRSLLEAAVSFSLNCREMYEHILSARALDESVSLGVVEPLYSALLSHFKTPEHSLECSLLLGVARSGLLNLSPANSGSARGRPSIPRETVRQLGTSCLSRPIIAYSASRGARNTGFYWTPWPSMAAIGPKRIGSILVYSARFRWSAEAAFSPCSRHARHVFREAT